VAIPSERIFLVENDPEISDLIARQTLVPLGYRVTVMEAAFQAIQEAARLAPDVIIANLNLPELSGKDLLIALASQGIDVPVIVLVERGMEAEGIQAFRLGAADYLGWPLREAEVVAAVERVLKQARPRQECARLEGQLKQAHQELQRRERELTTLMALGKAVSSSADQKALLEKIVEGAIYLLECDRGWFLLQKEGSKTLLLNAYRNLPPAAAARFNQPWDDGISALVAVSGESLAIHGEPLKRFKLSVFGQAALIVPVKVKREVVGLLVAVRQAPRSFNPNDQALLEAVADYTAIALVNARLFRELRDRAHSRG
jgi:DNA-binding response OmpR family regulator